jgi:hypothetical protein
MFAMISMATIFILFLLLKVLEWEFREPFVLLQSNYYEQIDMESHFFKLYMKLMDFFNSPQIDLSMLRSILVRSSSVNEIDH